MRPLLDEFEPGPQEPRGEVVFLWIVWLLLAIPLYFTALRSLFIIHFLAQLSLTTTWLALATHASARFFVPAGLCYVALFFLGGDRIITEGLISLGIFGVPWLILRVFRLLTLDYFQKDSQGRLITPKLAERAQFSLRTIGAVCVLVGLGCALWVGVDQFWHFRDLKYVVAIFVPCELLFLLGTLGRVAWGWRVGLITLSLILLLGWIWFMSHGRTNELFFSLLLPADQLIVLAGLRRIGYRIGMPRAANSLEEDVEAKQSQSPWDEEKA